MEFLERWLAHVRARVSPRTFERYEQVCRKNIGPLLGTILLAKLRPAQISEGYAQALASGRRNGPGGLSPRTVHHMHIILKGALQQAVKWDELARNPAVNVDPPKASRAPMKTYDLLQTADLLAASRGRRVFVPILLAVLCGMRRGEIAALRWRNIDLVAAQLAVVQSAEQTKAGVRSKSRRAVAHAQSPCPRRWWPSCALIGSNRCKNSCDWDDDSATMTSLWLSLTDRPCSRTASGKNGFASLQATPPCPAFASTTFDTRTPHTCWLRV